MREHYLTDDQKVSYGIGRQLGEQIVDKVFEGLDVGALTAGVADALCDEPMPIAESAMRAAFAAVAQRMEVEQALQARVQAAEGEAFLEENARREEVELTPSGLQYEVLSAGSGASPEATGSVLVHYRGTLIDGTVFDSSYERGEPLAIAVSGAIAGWVEALQMMAEGARWRLYVPPQLAYGEQGSGTAIAPCETLIFDVELLDILS